MAGAAIFFAGAGETIHGGWLAWNGSCNRVFHGTHPRRKSWNSAAPGGARRRQAAALADSTIRQAARRGTAGRGWSICLAREKAVENPARDPRVLSQHRRSGNSRARPGGTISSLRTRGAARHPDARSRRQKQRAIFVSHLPASRCRRASQAGKMVRPVFPEQHQSANVVATAAGAASMGGVAPDVADARQRPDGLAGPAQVRGDPLRLAHRDLRGGRPAAADPRDDHRQSLSEPAFQGLAGRGPRPRPGFSGAAGVRQRRRPDPASAGRVEARAV